MYNEARGIDSCGYYVSERDNLTPNLKKKCGKASTLLVPESLETGKLFIGHTRKGTGGYTTLDNAHPFEYPEVVGAHNGVLSNYSTLSKSREMESSQWNIDSQVLYLSMNKDIKDGKSGLIAKKNQFLNVLEDYDGGAALIFTLKDGKLYCFHDKDRPLFHGRIKINGKVGTYVSSTEDSLKAIGCSRVRAFPEDIVHIFKEGNLIDTFKIKHTPLKPEPVKSSSVYPDTVESRRMRNWGMGYGLDEFADEIDNSYPETPILPKKQDIFKGDLITPNSIGRLEIGSFATKLGTAFVLEIDWNKQEMEVKVVYLNHDYKGGIQKGDIWEHVPVAHFMSLGKSYIKGIEDQPKTGRIYNHTNLSWHQKLIITEKAVKDKLVKDAKAKCEADILVDELQAIEAQETSLKVTEFDDIRDQYCAILLEVRDKVNKINEGDWYLKEQEMEDLNTYIEEEIFTLFSVSV